MQRREWMDAQQHAADVLLPQLLHDGGRHHTRCEGPTEDLAKLLPMPMGARGGVGDRAHDHLFGGCSGGCTAAAAAAVVVFVVFVCGGFWWWLR